jgi:hypothetical protein
MSGRSIRLGVVAAIAGLSLTVGGLFFGSALVSADETPTPPAADATPAVPNATPAAPQDDGSGHGHMDGNCPGMDGGSTDSGSSSGTGFGGGRGFRGGPGSTV